MSSFAVDQSVVNPHMEAPIAEALGSPEYRRVSITGRVANVSNAYLWSNLLQRSCIVLSEIMSFVRRQRYVILLVLTNSFYFCSMRRYSLD